nr:zinc finger BED domain-containing protein RICESLEEPER 2-like [Ipomoea batatas]
MFPILRREHYFLICFDFRRYRLEVIDNETALTVNKQKYGESLEDMQIMLSEFYNKVHNGRSILCAWLVLKRMQMSWRDSKNKTDCRVYLMRHMESFVGQGVSDWDCSLVKGDYNTLHKLRLQYMKEVAVSEYNLHRARNLRRAYLLIGGPLAS